MIMLKLMITSYLKLMITSYLLEIDVEWLDKLFQNNCQNHSTKLLSEKKTYKWYRARRPK